MKLTFCTTGICAVYEVAEPDLTRKKYAAKATGPKAPFVIGMSQKGYSLLKTRLRN
jgi:hypothetical protein